MIEKLRTALWFARRPDHWAHMAALTRRQFDGSLAHENCAPQATAWAAERAVSVEDALRAVGVLAADAALPPPLGLDVLAAAQERAAASRVAMGGAGDLDLIYRAVLATGARTMIETGVAYGWSSLAALSALEHTGGRLISVDMPYPKAGNEPFVGIVVPDHLRSRWTLVRQPDRNGIVRAIALAGGHVDVVHYDSDKSYVGRGYAYPRLWRALGKGGLFVSDDIQDNFGFRDFARGLGLPFAVTSSDGKYVGLIRKP